MFCIRLPQEATVCFNFIDKLIIFAIFDDFFQIPAFNTYAALNGKLELTLLKGRQRFDTVSTSNLKV